MSRRLSFVVVVVGLAIAWPRIAAAQAQVSPFLNVMPGTTTKAEVDLAFGDPRRRVSPTEEVYEYEAPRGTDDVAHIEVTFFPDTRTTARVDVYFKTPVAAEPLRERIGGARVVSRPHPPGVEELFYPRLHGLVVNGTTPDAQALAFCYLSQRYLASVYVERFESQLAAKNLDAALVEAEKAAVVDPDGAQGYLAQARYYEAIGNLDEALAHYTTAGNAKTGQREKYRAALALASLYEKYRKANDRAEAELKRALSLGFRGEAAEAHVLYGEFLARQQKAEDARSEFQRALEIDPATLSAHAALGAMRWDAKAYKDALANYEAIAKAPLRQGAPPDPARGTALYRYGFTLADAGRTDDAIAAFEQALAANGPQSESRYQLGLAYGRKNDHVRAIAEFREALKAQPSDPVGVNASLTSALIAAGLGADALKQAELTLALAPQDARRMLDVARSYGLLKKRKESLDYAKRAIAAGLTDRAALTADPTLAQIQNDGNFKKLIAQLQ